MKVPGSLCEFGKPIKNISENAVFDFFRLYEGVVEIKNKGPDSDWDVTFSLLLPNIPGFVPKGSQGPTPRQ
jgi:hypothetical protein